MGIPDCYDPVYQAEHMAMQQDMAQKRLPVCSCCGHNISYDERFWKLNYRKKEITICEDCHQEIEDSETTLTELEEFYGADN